MFSFELHFVKQNVNVAIVFMDLARLDGDTIAVVVTQRSHYDIAARRIGQTLCVTLPAAGIRLADICLVWAQYRYGQGEVHHVRSGSGRVATCSRSHGHHGAEGEGWSAVLVIIVPLSLGAWSIHTVVFWDCELHVPKIFINC